MDRITIQRIIHETTNRYSCDYYEQYEREIVLIRKGFENREIMLNPFDRVFFENDAGKTVGKWVVSATKEEYEKYKKDEVPK